MQNIHIVWRGVQSFSKPWWSKRHRVCDPPPADFNRSSAARLESAGILADEHTTACVTRVLRRTHATWAAQLRWDYIYLRRTHATWTAQLRWGDSFAQDARHHYLIRWFSAAREPPRVWQGSRRMPRRSRSQRPCRRRARSRRPTPYSPRGSPRPSSRPRRRS